MLQRRFALLSLATLSILMLSRSSQASDITVASPVNGTSVSSLMWVRAHNIGCDGLPPTSFGYSLDNSSSFTHGVTDYDIDVTNQSIGSGSHVVHFKSWTSNGQCPTVDSSFSVGGSSSGSSSSGSSSGSSGSGSSIPSNAVASANLDTYGSWEGTHDGGTSGSARGSSVYPAQTPVYDDGREFYMTYSDHGGERWNVDFGNDASATHFVYDTYIYVVDPSQLQNIELDVNQVMSNGETVVYGTQCSSISKTWEYSKVANGGNHWVSSNIYCNPLAWAANTWHHVQIASHRDGNGVVTHDWVDFDGTHSTFSNATGSGAEWLGWATGAMLVNYQLDGQYSSGGSLTTYVHDMKVYHW